MWGGRLLLFDSLPSTNRWAMDNLADCRTGDVISAAIQTAGKGRFSREWLSPHNRGLAISTILRPPFIKAELIHATGFVAALAVHATLATCDLPCMLKWPNDVIADGRKISGILAEFDAASETIVLGIGLNVNVTSEDLQRAGLKETATSLLISRKREFSMDDVRKRLITSLQRTFDKVAHNGFEWVSTEWSHHDWLAGHIIEVQGPHGSAGGRYAGMDNTGAICLIDSAGIRQVFTAGDIVRLRKA